jgi:hypothetical protein
MHHLQMRMGYIFHWSNPNPLAELGNHFVILFAYRQLKDDEKNYDPFLLEAAAVFGVCLYLTNSLGTKDLSFYGS